MALKIVAAVAANSVIGRGGKLPWSLPDDLRRFKEQTFNHPVVMGSRTFDSIVERIGGPLPSRENIVLTRRPRARRCDGASFTDNFDEVVARAKSQDVFVIGGTELYRLALPVSDELLITRVLAAPSGDAFFPERDEKQWTRISSELHRKDARNEFDFIFEHYVRRSARYLEMANIRTPEQMADMKEILELGICPFCRDFIHTGDTPSDRQWHTQPILWSAQHWVLTFNKYAYSWTKPLEANDPEGRRLHLLLVLKAHAETLSEIPAGAFEELGSALRWAENEFNIEGGGFFLRFGEPIWTGGTIRHIHAHLAQRKDLETPAAFFLSEFRSFV